MRGPKAVQTAGSESGTAAGSGAEVGPEVGLHADMSRLLHDLNQPLSAITNYAQAGSHLSAGGSASPEQLRGLFDKIVEQSRRAGAISQELRKARDLDATRHPG